MMLVLLLMVGVITGYLGARTMFRNLVNIAEKLMSLSVYAIILVVGIEGGRSLTKLTGFIWEFGALTASILIASMLASFLIALILRRVGLLCK